VAAAASSFVVPFDPARFVPAPGCTGGARSIEPHLIHPGTHALASCSARRLPPARPTGVRLPVRRLVLGLLGPVASGKSHVAQRIAELGPGVVVDADQLAHEALDAAAADGRLAELLGRAAVGPDGRADRAALRARAHADPAVLKALEGLTHPFVKARIAAAVKAHRAGEGPPVLVLDVPLLLEAGLDGLCDEVWAVEVDDRLRLERARSRGLDPAALAQWERAQAPPAVKRRRAARVIHNDVPPDALDRQVRAGLAATSAA
jgi:dephospho-CoA kinase